METPLQPITTEKQRLIGVGALLSQSWSIFQKNFGLLIGVIAPGLIVAVVTGLLYFLNNALLGGLASFVTVIVSIWVAVALLYAVYERDHINVSEALKKGGRRFFSYLWISLLSGFIALGGFLLFIIPGIILSVWFSFGLYILVAEDRRGLNALLRSKHLVQGYWWPIFGRFLALGLLGIGVMAPFIIAGFLLENVENLAVVGLFQVLQGVASLLFSAFTIIFGFVLYENVKNVKGPAAAGEPDQSQKTKFILLGILGVLAIPIIMILLFAFALILTGVLINIQN